VYGYARIYGYARVFDNTRVYGNVQVYGDALVYGYAQIYGNACLSQDAKINRKGGIVWFCNVGSEYGTLTCHTGKNGQILVTRGCFCGTDEEFLAAVEEKHGASRIGKEYRLLIEMARLRLQQEGGNV